MKGRILFFSFAFLFIFSATVGAQQKPLRTQSANTARWTEDDRKELLTKAQRGDANSQMWLAAAYEQGWFGERNVADALKWFRKSAAKGNPDAQNSLGQMYQDGEGVKQSYVLAAKWYRKASDWHRNLACGFRIDMRFISIDPSQTARLHAATADFREINSGVAHVAVRLRDGEYSFQKTEGLWTLADYIPSK